MPGSRLTRAAVAAALIGAVAPLASCGGAAAAGGGKRLATWPLSMPDTVSAMVSAKDGATVRASAFGVDTEVVIPAGALAEDTEIEIVPLASSPLKDGKPNFSDGVFVRRKGDGVGAALELSKPAELRFASPKTSTRGVTIGRWYLSKATFEPVASTVTSQGSKTVVTAKLTTLAGYGARDPGAQGTH